MQLALGKPFEARGPNSARQAASNCVFGDAKTLQASGGGDCRSGVVELVASDKARQGQVEEAIFILENEASLLLENVPGAALCNNRRTEFASARFNNVKGLLVLARNDDRPAALDDPGFLARNRFDRVAEKSAMIE